MASNENNLDMMTQEEIERFLEQQQNTEPQNNYDDADLASLLSQLEGTDGEDLQEISDLLNKADNNEAVAEDVIAFMNMQEAEGENAYDAMDLFSGDIPEQKESFFKKLLKKFKKEKKKPEIEPQAEPTEEEEKKQDVMDLALAMLEENNTEEKPSEDTSVKKKKAKKEKKPKEPKKNKKGQNAKIEAEEGQEELDSLEEKGKKKKKDKKEKKEKKSKDKKNTKSKEQDELESIREKTPVEDIETIVEELDSDEMPNKKKIIVVFIAAVMIMLGYLVVNYYFTRHANKQLAEEAYEQEDYLECYQLLYGQRLNDSQAAMFHRSELLLKMDIFWNHYNEFVADQKQLEALDKLVQFVYEYPELSTYAKEWNCQDIVDNTYSGVMDILSKTYEADIQMITNIATLESDVDYTKALAELIKEKQKKDEINQKYPDILPEEEDRLTQD